MSEPPLRRGTGRRLLIVDDEPNVLAGMQSYLQPLGFRVDCARMKDEAEALLERTSYDCLIADLCLTPGRDPEGFEVIRFARAVSPRTRIVVLTALEGQDTAAESLRQGADLCLHKPQRLSEIVRIVNELVEPAG